MSNFKKELWRTVKFVLFSISAGIVQIASFTLLNEVLKVRHWVAYLVALILSVVWNFSFCRKFTFRSNTNVFIALLKVFGFYIIFTPLSTWWTAFLTEEVYGIMWNEYLVLALTMVVNFVSEYLYDTFVVFRGSIDTALKNNENTQTEE
ncbi:MAG: GtrA family protein [Clostridia bacterium]|nr:GtrA family protein [Clostridia bacterium]